MSVEVFEGEIVMRDLLGTSPADLLDPQELPPSTLDEARRRSEQIRAGLVLYVHTRTAIAEAWARRDWKVLDYDNWDAYLTGEFGDELRRLTGDERREAVAEYRQAGMSTRAIASAVQAPKSTVADDVRQLPGSGQLPETVKGLDGRDMPAKRDPKPSAQLTGSGQSTGPASPAPEEKPAVEPERPKPPKWDPEEREAHEAEVRKQQDIASAKRASQTIVTEFRSLVVTVVSGCRYGEKGLVTREMIADLRKTLDLLEGEL